MEMEAGINASRVLGGGLVARKSTSFSRCADKARGLEMMLATSWSLAA